MSWLCGFKVVVRVVVPPNVLGETLFTYSHDIIVGPTVTDKISSAKYMPTDAWAGCDESWQGLIHAVAGTATQCEAAARNCQAYRLGEIIIGRRTVFTSRTWVTQ